MARKHNKRYVCDFETSTPEFYEKDGFARVWAWAKVDIDNIDDFEYGTTIEELFDWFENLHENVSVFFHNLKFDGQYIISYITDHNYKWVDYDPTKKVKFPPHTYSTIITDVGQWYQITLFYKDHTISIKDSMKLYNMSVDVIAKSLGLEEQKLTLDYERYRPIGYKLTPHEIEYIKHDVVIVAKALKPMFDEGHTKLTAGSNALSDYKKRTKNFKELFPVLDNDEDAFVRSSYKGGFTYANPVHTNHHYKRKGVVFDYNSLYPSILHDMPMPKGKGIWFDGQYQKDEKHPLYIQRLTCDFELKKGKIPSIQLKHNMQFLPNEYVTEGFHVTLTLASPDLELFFEQYDVDVYKYDGGYKYEAESGLFKDFIDHWTERKIEAKKDGNKALYALAKITMNSTYGKFGTNPHGAMKRPVPNPDGLISYPIYEDNSRKSVYCPVATFTTAYGRKRIIEACQFIRDWSISHKGYDAWTYSDTDSIHAFLNKRDIEHLSKRLQIDDYKLGYLKLESEFTEAKYLRQKCYMERMPDGNLNVTIAGLPKKLAPIMSFDTFNVGFSTKDLPEDYLDSIGYKLTYKQVKGGVLLVKTDFTIK